MTTNVASSSNDNLNAARAAWRAQVERELGGVPFEKKVVTRLPEGIAVQPLYTRAGFDGAAAARAENDGRRGGRAFRAGERAWEVAQEIAAPDAATFNTRLRAALMAGQDSVVVLPEAIGVSAAEGFAAAVAGVDLSAVPLHVVTSRKAAEVTAWLGAVGVGRGCVLLRGATGAEQRELLAWAQARGPGLKVVGIEGRAWHEAGANAVQELAATLAGAVAAVRELGGGAAASLHVTLAIGPHFFTEIAKFRAWRVLWFKAVTAAGLGEHAAACTVRAVQGRRHQSRLDVHVNALRATTAGLAAVVGGADAVSLDPWDALEGGDDEVARRVSRNLHFLLAEEFHFTDTADPAGGSWCVESLTDEVARAAWTLFQGIEKRGGLASADALAWLQAEVAKNAAAEAQALALRRRVLVGVNMFPAAKDRVAPSNEKSVRAALPYEQLRAAVAAATKRPTLHLAKVGTVKQHKPRADFTAGFFAIGGWELRAKEIYADAASAAAGAVASGAPVTVLCSSDDLYPELVPAYAAAVKAAAPHLVVILAGLPADAELVAKYRAAGVDDFIHLKADALALNLNLLARVGISV